MIYGTHLSKDSKYHTYLEPIFSAIGNRQNDYNWLIADFVCYPKSTRLNEALGISPSGTDCPAYRFFSGEELTQLIRTENVQWIWGVFCAFEKHVPLDEILSYPLPMSEGYDGLYRLPVAMQHPLSQVEIYADDSSATIFLSRKEHLTSLLRAAFATYTDLHEYISRPKRRTPLVCDIFRKI